MKKITHLIGILTAVLFFNIGNAQIVNIPDANFKAELLQASTSNTIAKNATGQNIKIDTNDDGEIQVSEALAVYQLDVQNSNIENLTGIEAFVNLTHLRCATNSLIVLSFSSNVNLTHLWCDDNDLIYLDISNNINLIMLSCSGNNLTSLDISNNINLAELGCAVNNLTELDVSNNTNLTYLHVYNNPLTELDVSNNVNLISLYVNYNSLTELDVSNNVNLTTLQCMSNNLTELNLSNQPNLENLNATSNPQLAYINIKNGGILNPNTGDFYWSQMWGNLPNNIYICADEDEAVAILPYLNQSGATGQIIATYCYIPGGNYNTITGTITYDFNNNGCDENDNVTILTKVTIDDGTDGGVSFTNQDGEYKFFTQDGTFILTPEIENPSYFNVTPITETVVFADNDNNEEIVNFCITPNGVHNDLEVVIAPITPAVPGFEATYKIVYRNKGNQVMSQDYGLNFFYNQQLMSFVSASIAPDTQGPGGLNWNYEDLMPFESREILVTMQINPPTDPENPVNIDDELIFTSVISPQTDDENVLDNTFIFNQTVIGSYDPNDITCIEGDIIEPEYIGEELHYLIRFENTGNYYAENVVVAMEIDEEKYDMTSVRLLNTSHNANAQIKDNVLEVFFNQIMLDSGGHGNILLVMKSINTLSEGDSVESKADIYFDYNYPIITNDAVTIFQATASIENNIQNIDLKFYPNPTTDYFNITSEALIQSVELYDVSGRLVRTSLVNDFESKQNINNLNNGVYILKIKTQQGEITGKIIKK